MAEYLVIFSGAGVDLPVICGGAALNDAFVRKELQPKYRGRVYYARDAMEGLKIVQSLDSGHRHRKPETRGPANEGATGSGIRVARDVPLDELLPLIDRKALFSNRWQMVSKDISGRNRKQQLQVAQNCLDILVERCRRERLFEPQTIHGVFQANWESPLLKLRRRKAIKTIDLRLSGKLADRLMAKEGRVDFVVGLQIVTLGGRIKKEFSRLKKQNKIKDQFLLYGLSAELTEALAKWAHQRTQKAMGAVAARRFSPGYPVWPDLSEQEKVFFLLKPQRIGVRLSTAWQMDPEFSTSAILIKIA
jgi:5-methyltetrahydrofolate--homocysteine methyltransferase